MELNTQLSAVQMILVTALVTVEHDREKHVPGVKSGPEAETFLVPGDVAESLIKAGAVKRADVIDADALLSTVDTSSTGAESSTGLVTTFADVADRVEADSLRAQLAEAAVAKNDLVWHLNEAQDKLKTTQEALDAANAQIAQLQDQAGGNNAISEQLKTTQEALDAANAQIAQFQTQIADANAVSGSGSSSAAAGDADAQASSTAAPTTRRKAS